MSSPSFNHNQQSLKCGSTLRSTGSGMYLSDSFLALLSSLRSLARRAVLAGRAASTQFSISLIELVSNDRHLAGLGFGMVGAIAIFFHLLFDESVRKDPMFGYYENAYYFMYSLRQWFVLIFVSTSLFLFHPVKSKSIWIVYALAVSVGVCGVVHYSFFVTDYASYHSFPVWYVIIFSLGIGAGFLKAMDYLLYRKYHLKDGNIARIIGVIRMPNVDAQTKMGLLENLVKESENYNSRI